jgi:hypothetical protein
VSQKVRQLELGQIVVQPVVWEVLRIALRAGDEHAARFAVGDAVNRHQSHDWGELISTPDRLLNESIVTRPQHLMSGHAVLSCYCLSGVYIEIVTKGVPATTMVRVARAQRALGTASTVNTSN